MWFSDFARDKLTYGGSFSNHAPYQAKTWLTRRSVCSLAAVRRVNDLETADVDLIVGGGALNLHPRPLQTRLTVIADATGHRSWVDYGGFPAYRKA